MRIRALVVLSLAALMGLTVACDESLTGVRLVDHASFIGPSIVGPSGRLSPNPVVFPAIVGIGCPGGFVFAPSLNLIVTAGVDALTLDHVTLHMIDGSNLGGPSITIPQSAFAGQTSSVFVHAGTTHDFALSPNFGCIATLPLAVAGNAFLFDSRGMNVTIPVEGPIR